MNTMRQERKRATQLTVKTQNSAGCQSMPISWDASAGKAPWTVMIAPVNQVPYTFDVPQASGSNFAVNWAVPKLSKDSQAMVAVSDSTGAYSGVSSLVTIAAGTGSCSAISDSLDFIWFPTKNSDTPDQCADWAITWQQDKGNNGVTGQVSYTFLPENGQPVTVAAGTGNTGAFTFTVPFNSGTRFLAIGNDGGKAGTGGVGDVYTVSAAKRTKACKAAASLGNGLPSPSATMSAVSSSSTATQSSTKSSAKTKSTSAAAATNTNAQNTSSDSSSSSKSSTAGTAAGATVGVLAGLAIIGLLVWWFRRRRARSMEKEKAWGGATKLGSVGGASGSASGGPATNDSNYPVSPWRWSASPFDPPQTSKGPGWMRRISGSSGAGAAGAGAGAAGAAAGGFRVLSGRNNQHGRGDSFTSGAQPTMQQATFRNMSVPNDGYSAAPPVSELQLPQQPTPAYGHGSDASGQSIHTTVPDAALFPPPNPSSYGMYDDSPYGVARQQQYPQQQYMQQPVYNDDPRSRSPFRDPAPPQGYGGVGAGVGAAGMSAAMMYQAGGPTSEIRQGTAPHDSYAGSSGGPPSRTLTNSSQGHNSFKSASGPQQISSEVMLADNRFDGARTARKPIPEEDEEEGLPYL